jgi:hypothetical protein
MLSRQRTLAGSSALAMAAVFMVFVMVGCAAMTGPKVPKVFVIDTQADKDVLGRVQRYRDCLAGMKKEDCKQPDKDQRDTIVYDLKLIIDRNYEDYAHAFERTQDASLFLGETSGATLTAVATLVGATPAKDILTTASTLVQSTSLSAQKNFYQKQTSYAILNVMDSDRAKKWSTIYDNLTKLDIHQYPLSAALSDLVDYREDGTAIHALASIVQTSGATKQDATAAIAKTDTDLKTKNQ